MVKISDQRPSVARVLDSINQAWQVGRWSDLEACFHEDIVMALPGFTGRSRGAPELLAGIQDFTETTRLDRFGEKDREIDVIGDTAVATFTFEIVYERQGEVYAGTGRDLWVFQRRDDEWLAVWRAMFDVDEKLVTEP